MDTDNTDAFSARAKEWDNPAKIEMTSSFTSKIREKYLVRCGNTVIEIGCGTGLVGLEFARMAGHLTMVDTSTGMLDVLREKVRDKNIDNITIVHGEISQVAGDADVIIIFMTLHHIGNIGELISRAKERLVEGGVIIVGDLYPDDGSFHAGTTVPYNGFDPEWLEEQFYRQNFQNVSFEPLTVVEKRGRRYGLFFLAALK